MRRRLDPRTVRAAVDRNQPEEVAIEIVVEDRDLTRILHDPLWRADAGHTGRPAAECRIDVDLVVLQLLHLGEELRLVFRRPRVVVVACALDRKSTRLNSSHGY